MDRTACTEPQCLYKGDLYLYLLFVFFLPKLYGTMISNVSIHFLVTNVANVLMVTTIQVSKYTALAGHTLKYDSES